MCLLAIMCWSFQAEACDACGCSIVNTGNGLTTVFKKNFFSLAYFGYGFEGALNQTLSTKDGHYSITATARISPARNWYITASLPFKWNERSGQSGNYQVSGLGDIQVAAHRILWTYAAGSSSFYVDGGLGIKIPVSKFNPHPENGELPVNFNVGSGSWSPHTRLNGVYQFKNLGLLVSPFFQWSPPNANSYQFGKQVSVQISAFYQMKASADLSMTPYLGFYVESIGRDVNETGKYEHGTGASGKYSLLGFNVKWKSVVFDFSAFLPLQSSYASGEVTAGKRWALQATYLF